MWSFKCLLYDVKLLPFLQSLSSFFSYIVIILHMLFNSVGYWSFESFILQCKFSNAEETWYKEELNYDTCDNNKELWIDNTTNISFKLRNIL